MEQLTEQQSKMPGAGVVALAAGEPAFEELDLLAYCDTFAGFHTKACCVTFAAGADHGGVRGMAASCDIKAGEDIVAIPDALLVSPGGKGIHALYQWLAEQYDQDPDLDTPYLASIRHTPVVCAADFAPTQVTYSATLSKEVAEAAKTMLRVGRELPAVSSAAARWAYCVVATRACFYPPGGNTASEKQALLPCFDLINHHATDDNCTGEYVAGRGVFVARATRAIKKGQQVYLSYGHLPNSLLLMRYGFTLVDNPHDYYSDFTLADLLGVGGLSSHVSDMSSGAAAEMLACCGCSGTTQFYVARDTGADYPMRVVVRMSQNMHRLTPDLQAAILDEEWLDAEDEAATNMRLRHLLGTRADVLRKAQQREDQTGGLRGCLSAWILILEHARAACT